MIISLKEITNTTDVVFFVIAILLLAINIVLNIRNFLLLNRPKIKSIIQTALLTLRFGQIYHRHFLHISLFLIILFV